MNIVLSTIINSGVMHMQTSYLQAVETTEITPQLEISTQLRHFNMAAQTVRFSTFQWVYNSVGFRSVLFQTQYLKVKSTTLTEITAEASHQH